MSQEVQVYRTGEIVNTQSSAGQVILTRDQIDLIKRTIAKDATDDELELFLHICKRTGLDPLARQIYCIHRGAHGNKKMSIQTGIDGYRLVAERTGVYAGSDLPVFGPMHGRYPEWATKTVYKIVQGTRCAFTAIAYWDEYCPAEGQRQMWDKFPRLMLAKCAEAQALREAFPSDLSGIYTDEEMDQADMRSAPPGQRNKPRPPALPQGRASLDDRIKAPVDTGPNWRVIMPRWMAALANPQLPRPTDTDIKAALGVTGKADWLAEHSVEAGEEVLRETASLMVQEVLPVAIAGQRARDMYFAVPPEPVIEGTVIDEVESAA